MECFVPETEGDRIHGEIASPEILLDRLALKIGKIDRHIPLDDPVGYGVFFPDLKKMETDDFLNLRDQKGGLSGEGEIVISAMNSDKKIAEISSDKEEGCVFPFGQRG